ncbi:response regulator transcription factor [Mobilitalea sibirica]|uniref:Stage 0 sporulation protein A homolog n=1 Tax=Mobilitalea sibirica TaxID=1462919 RepID=A0A8J7KV12_9FIRM|nr:response regulator transcription factor [Mobilitalea sibirica]MBH1939625.1 response regulator transcription factor [Mobilitalea sibirica]
MKLLIVEDEIRMKDILAKGLKKCGYAVDTAIDGEEALELFEINEYDLIVLDLNLPKVDGMEVLRTIRSTNQTVKVLILSARSEVEDKIVGLDDGGNDYLIKPFDFKELEARIRCLLRQQVMMQETILHTAGITLNLAKCIAMAGEEELGLTKKEFSILHYLVLHKNTIISSEQLIEHVWDSDADLFSNSFKFHMSSLRKKIAEKLSQEVIRNIRGIGYMIEDKAGDSQ